MKLIHSNISHVEIYLSCCNVRKAGVFIKQAFILLCYLILYMLMLNKISESESESIEHFKNVQLRCT